MLNKIIQKKQKNEKKNTIPQLPTQNQYLAYIYIYKPIEPINNDSETTDTNKHQT